MLDFNITYSKTVLYLELCRLYNVLRTLQKENQLEIFRIKHQMSVLNVDFSLFSNYSTLANMLILDVIHVGLIIFLSENPLAICF